MVTKQKLKYKNIFKNDFEPLTHWTCWTHSVKYQMTSFVAAQHKLHHYHFTKWFTKQGDRKCD